MKLTDSNLFHVFGRRTMLKDNNTENHQGQESPDVYSSESRIRDIQRTEREALIHQAQRLYAANEARTNAVLERIRYSIQQDPLPSPQPPAGSKQRPASSVRRLRPIECVQRNQRSSRSQDEEVFVSSRESNIPSELSSISHISSPVEVSPPQEPAAPSPPPPPPPQAQGPRKRAHRLPVFWMHHCGKEKDVGGGYKLHTSEGQVEEIQKSLENFKQNSICHVPQPAPEPRNNPSVRNKRLGVKRERNIQDPHVRTALKGAPMKRNGREDEPIKSEPVEEPEFGATPQPATFSPAPAPNPAPPKKRGTRHGTSLRPAKSNNRGKKTDGTSDLKKTDCKKVEELQPLYNPEEGLSDCFKLLSSDDWMKKTEGLRTIRVLAQHHPETLVSKLLEVCLALVEEVHNLRSSVACAAMDTVVHLYVHLQRDMDPQVERTGRALLLRIAQSSANAFMQQQANAALEVMVENCSPGRVINALLNTGLNHKCTAVRASTAQQLHLLVDRLGADSIFSAGKHNTYRVLTAVSKMSLDAAAEVRPHGLAMLQALAPHRDFAGLWKNIIDIKDQRLLERVLRTSRIQ